MRESGQRQQRAQGETIDVYAMAMFMEQIEPLPPEGTERTENVQRKPEGYEPIKQLITGRRSNQKDLKDSQDRMRTM